MKSDSIKEFLQSNKILLVCNSLLLITRCLTLLSNPKGNLLPDSSTYLPTQWGDFSKVSFMGDAKRSWVVPLFYALLPNMAFRVLFQLIIGACVWVIVLRFVYLRFCDHKNLNIVLIMLSIIGCSPSIVQFETSMLATSIILDVFLILIVYILNLTNKNKLRFSQGLVLMTIFWLIISLKATNALIAIVLLAFFLATTHRKFYKPSLLILVLISIGLIAQSGVMNINNDRQWDYSYSSFTMLWHLGVQSPTATNLTAYLETKKAPKCLIEDAPFRDINQSIARIQNECPEAKRYLKAEFKRQIFNFLITNPGVTIRNLSTGMAIAFTSTGSNYGSAVSVLPQSISNIVFGGISPDFRTMGVNDQSALGLRTTQTEPLWIFMPGIAFAFLPIWMRAKLLIKSVVGQMILLVHTLLVAEIILTISILPSEWFRQNVQYVVSLYVLGLISLLVTKNENASRNLVLR